MRGDDREELRRAALAVFQAGVAAVDGRAAVASCLSRDRERLLVRPAWAAARSFHLGAFSRVVIVGAGKASAGMASVVEEVLGERIDTGIVIVKHGHRVPTQRVRVLEAGHPVPDAEAVAATRELVGLVGELGSDSLVIAVLSGGGSSLLCLPAAGLSLEDEQAVTRALLEAGADIRELNVVRKHLSAVKGGWLARRAHPAAVVNLVLSDVIGDPLDVIASGPFCADPSTFAEARAVLERRGLWSRAPAAVRRHLERGETGELAETPKPGDSALARVTHVIVASNRAALAACKREAERLGFRALVLSSSLTGEAREVAHVITALAREVVATGSPVPAPACLIWGGETTVTVRGDGRGGRNQELALSAALDIAGLSGVVVLSAGTDGTDGPTDVAGAVVDGGTLARGGEAGLSAHVALERNDSHRFLAAAGDLLRTGPTGTNVMDIGVALIAGHGQPGG